MTRYGTLLAVLVAVSMGGCAPSQKSGTDLSNSDNPDAFKAAIIAYIDSHQGGFIGRPDSSALKDAKVSVGNASNFSDNKEPVYYMDEFAIYPDKMQFHAYYGLDGPEPYLYDGTFRRNAAGHIEVADVKLTRHHRLSEK